MNNNFKKKHKVGRFWSRLAWAKCETIASKITREKRVEVYLKP
jgi:hypothetical protein